MIYCSWRLRQLRPLCLAGSSVMIYFAWRIRQVWSAVSGGSASYDLLRLVSRSGMICFVWQIRRLWSAVSAWSAWSDRSINYDLLSGGFISYYLPCLVGLSVMIYCVWRILKLSAVSGGSFSFDQLCLACPSVVRLWGTVYDKSAKCQPLCLAVSPGVSLCLSHGPPGAISFIWWILFHYQFTCKRKCTATYERWYIIYYLYYDYDYYYFFINIDFWNMIFFIYPESVLYYV